MAALLSQAVAQGVMVEYARKLMAVFEATVPASEAPTNQPAAQSPLLDEPLTTRELEVLQLIAKGLSNQEISEQLFLALITVKVHNQKIFGKLQVKRRTEAVARARELGLIA
jgi:LuxR family maltose regulon positive regulatory protein